METSKRTASKATLKKYGLSQEEWQALYYKFDGCCWICGRSLEGKLACVDHEHVKGFKKMSPEEKKKHLRGILCYQDNKLVVSRVVTPERLRKAAKYLEEHEKRMPT